MRLSTILGWLVVASIPASILLAIAGSVGTYTYGVRSAAQLVAWSFAFGLAALPCSMCFERGRHRVLMASGMAGAGLSFLSCAVLTLLEPWLALAHVAFIVHIATPVFAWTGWCMIVAILHVRRTTSPLAIVLRRATAVLAAALGLTIVSLLWAGDDFLRRHHEDILRVGGGLALLTFFGLASSFLVVRLSYAEPDRVMDAEEDVVRRDFTVTCPRCGLRQGIRTGGAACGRCGLGIKVLVP